MNTIATAATFIYNEKNDLVGFIIRDEKTGYNLIYSCSKMSIDDIAELIEPAKKPL